jgi:hypothetical protein
MKESTLSSSKTPEHQETYKLHPHRYAIYFLAIRSLRLSAAQLHSAADFWAHMRMSEFASVSLSPLASPK